MFGQSQPDSQTKMPMEAAGKTGQWSLGGGRRKMEGRQGDKRKKVRERV